MITSSPCTIYLAVNRVNGKAYVGQTATQFHVRISNHLSVASLGGDETPFHRALRKYGTESFDFAVLEHVSTENADMAEWGWISLLGSMSPDGYNRTSGGRGAPNCEYTEERREKVRQSQLGDKNRMKNPATAKKHGDSIRGERNYLFGKRGSAHPSWGMRWKATEAAKLNKKIAFNAPDIRKSRSARALSSPRDNRGMFIRKVK